MADVPTIKLSSGIAVMPIANSDGTVVGTGAVIGALPAGTNNIGDVDVLTIAAGDNNIGNVDIASIAAGNNNIGDVDVASIAAGTNNIGDVDVATMPGWSSAAISSATTTTVKSSAGVCHAIIAVGGTMGAVTIYDNTAASGTVLLPATTPAQGNVLMVDATFGTGLTIVTAAATILFVAYR